MSTTVPYDLPKPFIRLREILVGREHAQEEYCRVGGGGVGVMFVSGALTLTFYANVTKM